MFQFLASARKTRFACLWGAVFAGTIVMEGCSPRDSLESPNSTVRPEDVIRYDGLSADEVVSKMVAAYQNATSYMDNAEYQERFTQASRGVATQTPPHVTSVVFVRPNKVRVTRFVPSVEGPPQLVAVVSDGDRLVADVSDLNAQFLDVEAPADLTPDSIAPDPVLRTALFPVPMENLYPQLALLLAPEEVVWPLSAQEFEMLPPKLLEREDSPSIPCFRVRIPTTLGAYTYWIDRKTFVLHRLELPSDEVRRRQYPDLDLGSYQLVIEFFDASLDVQVPDEAFQLEAPPGARRVAAFETLEFDPGGDPPLNLEPPANHLQRGNEPDAPSE